MPDPLQQMGSFFVWAMAAQAFVLILGAIFSFFVARWFLLHVFAIQQKRFFEQLDIFLYQRGIAPHVPEAKPAPSRGAEALAGRVKEAAKDVVAAVDGLVEPKEPAKRAGANPPARSPSQSAPYTDQTRLEKAWQELNKPQEPSQDDSRFRPKP